jgi:hypothetical protein
MAISATWTFMTNPSSANSQDPAGPVPPVVERGAVGPGATNPAVKGEPAPRLPHEHDESSDSGTGEPTERMERAADDVRRGRTDDPRGPETQRHYSDLTRKAQKDVTPSDAPPDPARDSTPDSA